MSNDIETLCKLLCDAIDRIPTPAGKLSALNQVRKRLHAISPMKHHPIDLVLWVGAESVDANDYNPNVVARPEMQLLETSILEDGYTQPVVTWVEEDGRRETIDGFHRGEIGRHSIPVGEQTNGFLPVTTVNHDRTDRGDRMASTIRHNRARGRHMVERMSDVVQELARRNWSDKKIGRELGMEPDEVLRLKQISGLAELFADGQYSEAWEPATEEEE